MKTLLKFDLPNLLRQIKTEWISIRRRFVAYIISAIAMVLSLILLLLNLFGIMNPAGAQIMNMLDTQLSMYADSIKRDYNKTAAHAISFADQLEAGLQSFLTEQNLSFDHLKNNAEALSALQGALYDTVYLNMQIATSSGAF